MSELMKKIVSRIYETNSNVYRISLMGDKIGHESEIVIPSNPCQDIYSVSKAFVVTAIGMMFDAGLLKTEDKVTDILDEYVPSDIDTRWHNITIDDALKHRMGHPCGFLDIDVSDANEFGIDYLDYLFHAPFVTEPASLSVYTDGAYYLLSRVVEKLAGESVDNLLWRNLFAPLHFREAAWSHCPKGHVLGATGLYVRADDTVKLGEIYRKGGVFEEKRIISEKWVRTVLERGYEFHPTGFGDSYGKGGMCGQMLAVFPSKKLSVCWTGYNMTHSSDILKLISEI